MQKANGKVKRKIIKKSKEQTAKGKERGFIFLLQVSPERQRLTVVLFDG